MTQRTASNLINQMTKNKETSYLMDTLLHFIAKHGVQQLSVCAYIYAVHRFKKIEELIAHDETHQSRSMNVVVVITMLLMNVLPGGKQLFLLSLCFQTTVVVLCRLCRYLMPTHDLLYAHKLSTRPVRLTIISVISHTQLQRTYLVSLKSQQ